MDRDLRPKKINEPSVASRRSTLGNELDLAFGRFAPESAIRSIVTAPPKRTRKLLALSRAGTVRRTFSVARLIEAGAQAIAASWREVALLLANPDAIRL